jgi:hypothetical protein
LVANASYSLFNVAGNPGEGVLAGTSLTPGVIPTDLTPGCIPISDTVIPGLTGYLSRVDFSWPVTGKLEVFDMLWKGGAYAFNANQAVALSDYSSRVNSYVGLEIYYEAVTAFTGSPTFTVTYVNQDGTAGRTATWGAAAPGIRRVSKLTLQAEDTGVTRITNVQCTVASAGTFNILVLRKLWEGRSKLVSDQYVFGPDQTGMPAISGSTALYVVATLTGTVTSTPEINLDIISTG